MYISVVETNYSPFKQRILKLVMKLKSHPVLLPVYFCFSFFEITLKTHFLGWNEDSFEIPYFSVK